MDFKKRNKKYKATVRKKAAKFKKKLVINKEKIKERYLETRKVELGLYRHNKELMNYDEVIKMINASG